MDRGWSWVVMAACFLNLFIGGILVYSVGVIHVALLETYRQDNAKTAWVGAIHSSLMSLAGPLSGLAIGRLGCRVTMFIGGLTILLGCSLSAFVNSVDALMVTYGLIGGLGLNFVYVPAMVAMGYHFDRYRGMASALAVTGGGLGMFAGGPITRLLLNTYGMKGTFLMLGAMGFHDCFLGMLIRPSKLELRIKQLGVEMKRRQALLHGAPSLMKRIQESLRSYLNLFKYYGFVCHTVSILLWNVGFSAVMLHLPGYSMSLGSSPSAAAALYTGLGIGSLVARLLTGPMLSDFTSDADSVSLEDEREPVKMAIAATERADRKDKPEIVRQDSGFDPLTLHFSGLGLSALATVLFPLYSCTYHGQMTFAVLFGLYSGVPIALLTPLTVELAGVDRLASAFGFETLMLGIGYCLGPPLAGLFVDYGGTYSMSMIFSGAVTMLASLISFVTCVLHAKYKPSAPALSPTEVKVEVTEVESLSFLPPTGSLRFLSSTASLQLRHADG